MQSPPIIHDDVGSPGYCALVRLASPLPHVYDCRHMVRMCVLTALIVVNFGLRGCAEIDESIGRPLWLDQLLNEQQTRVGGSWREALYDHVVSLKGHAAVIEQHLPNLSDEEARILAINLAALAKRRPRIEYLRICDLIEARATDLRYDLRYDTTVIYSYYDLEHVGSRYLAILGDTGLSAGIREEAARELSTKWNENPHEPLKLQILPVTKGVLAERAQLWLKVQVLILMRTSEVVSVRECLDRLAVAMEDQPEEAHHASEIIEELRAICR